MQSVQLPPAAGNHHRNFAARSSMLLFELSSNPDPEKARKTMQTLLQIKKVGVKVLQKSLA